MLLWYHILIDEIPCQLYSCHKCPIRIMLNQYQAFTYINTRCIGLWNTMSIISLLRMDVLQSKLDKQVASYFADEMIGKQQNQICIRIITPLLRNCIMFYIKDTTTNSRISIMSRGVNIDDELYDRLITSILIYIY